MKQTLYKRVENIKPVPVLATALGAGALVAFVQMLQPSPEDQLQKKLSQESKVIDEYVSKLDLPQKPTALIKDKNIVIFLFYLQFFVKYGNNRRHFQDLVHMIDQFCEIRNQLKTVQDVFHYLDRINERLSPPWTPEELLTSWYESTEVIYSKMGEMQATVVLYQANSTQSFDAVHFFQLLNKEVEISNWIQQLAQKKSMDEAFHWISGSIVSLLEHQGQSVGSLIQNALSQHLRIPNQTLTANKLLESDPEMRQIMMQVFQQKTKTLLQ